MLRRENTTTMRNTLFLLSIFFASSLGLLAQELIETSVFEDGSFKTFVYQDESSRLYGEWYIYNSSTDSMLFASGPVVKSKEDLKYVQNGTWDYNNFGQVAKKVAYVLGDEHSTDLRSNYHVGQSYFPVSMYHITNEGDQDIDYRPNWSTDEFSSTSSIINARSLELSQLNEPFILSLPELVLNLNSKKISPETFRIQFHFTPRYNSSKDLFILNIAGDENAGYYFSCKGNGEIELGNRVNGELQPVIKEVTNVNVNDLNKLDLQINKEGAFVLVLNDFVQSSRMLEVVDSENSKLYPISGKTNSLQVNESLRISLLDLSTLQFVEEAINDSPGLLFRDICEIGLAVINGIVDISDEEVYMRELEVTDISSKFMDDSRMVQVNLCFPAKLEYSTKNQSLELSIHLNKENGIEKIEKILNKGSKNTLDLKLLSSYLEDKFRTKTYAISSTGMSHNNLFKSTIISVPPTKNVKTTGQLFELTAKTSFRIGPSSSERVLLRFSEGDVVDLIEKTNVFWWKIKFKGKVGFVKAALLEPIE